MIPIATSGITAKSGANQNTESSNNEGSVNRNATTNNLNLDGVPRLRPNAGIAPPLDP